MSNRTPAPGALKRLGKVLAILVFVVIYFTVGSVYAGRASVYYDGLSMSAGMEHWYSRPSGDLAFVYGQGFLASLAFAATLYGIFLLVSLTRALIQWIINGTPTEDAPTAE